ncbi:MAG: hypothetical protein ABSG43_06575 [Solirubrobacteraceae bacterium]
MGPFYDSSLALATSRRKQAQCDAASAGTAYTHALLLELFGAGVSVLLGIGIALSVSGSIKRRVDVVLSRLRSLEDHCLTHVGDGLEAFARGDLTHSYEPVTALIENPSEDEIGQVAPGGERDPQPDCRGAGGV